MTAIPIPDFAPEARLSECVDAGAVEDVVDVADALIVLADVAPEDCVVEDGLTLAVEEYPGPTALPIVVVLS